MGMELQLSYAFTEGECVNHKCGSLASIVVGRGMTAAGREQYRIERTAKSAVARRTILGDALVLTRRGSAECDGCMLLRCPRR